MNETHKSNESLTDDVKSYVKELMDLDGEFSVIDKVMDKFPNMNYDHAHKIINNYDKWSNSNESFTKVVEACGCKQKAQESINNYKLHINNQIQVLKKRAKAGESVNLMYGLPNISKQGKKIKGTLAYAGVSLNDRIYLPETLAKGHGKTLPLLLNHSSTAGAEQELHRLSEEILDHLENERDFQVGEVTLTWDPDKLTLFYEGVIDNEFFQNEVDEMDMAVSLGIYYDSNSPRVCDENCYTLIKGAEFREVSLVYHAGFPIATIEAVEAELKRNALRAMEDNLEGARHQMHNDVKRLNNQDVRHGGFDWQEKGEAQTKWIKGSADNKWHEIDSSDRDYKFGVDKKPSDEADAEEITDNLARGGAVDVVPVENPKQAIIAESLSTIHDFSIRGVAGMTISNSNGVERYTLDPSMSYETNMIHFNVAPNGAQIFGEEIQLQPKMTTPKKLTKEIESKPNIKFTDSDEDMFKKKA
jgi:hypothetical protein